MLEMFYILVMFYLFLGVIFFIYECVINMQKFKYYNWYTFTASIVLTVLYDILVSWFFIIFWLPRQATMFRS